MTMSIKKKFRSKLQIQKVFFVLSLWIKRESMAHHQMGAMSIDTINNMRKGGANQADINYAIATQNSMDPGDVRRHRAYINQYNPGDPFRPANNFVMHPTDYRFGTGVNSPQSIGAVLGTLPGPVFISGPAFPMHPAIAPHVTFGYPPAPF